jgi:succinate-semialdehyde dehydrogenase/glutarate-semialdehyde dehydrogenase
MTTSSTAQAPEQAAYPTLGLFIGGQWIGADARETLDVIEPATGSVLGALPIATTVDLDAALASAQKGFETWRKVPAWERGRILKRAADLMRERVEVIAHAITREQGKTLAESRGEVLRTADTFEWSGEEARHRAGRVLPRRAPGVQQLVVEEPVGPVAAFAPWNYPVLTPGRKLAELLAAGCSCVIKPSEEVPASFLEVVRACLEAGVEEHAINVVFGDPPTISEHLIASPIIRKVSFTGSIPVGRHLAELAARGLKRVTLELGGHAPVIVFDDADIETVALMAAKTKFRNAGQVCVAPSRFYVQRGVVDEFAQRFADAAFSLRVGDGLDPETDMGPLIDGRRVRVMQDLVEDSAGRADDVRISERDVPSSGAFWRPTVIVNPPDDARVMQEEPFGPVAPIASFTDVEDVLTRANRLPFGLAGYAFTNSLRRISAITEGLEVGMIAVNSFECSTPESPFGGIKDSGYGSEGGVEGLSAFLVPKYVNQR